MIMEHLHLKRLIDISQTNETLTRTELAHLQDCRECAEKYAEFLRQRSRREVPPEKDTH